MTEETSKKVMYGNLLKLKWHIPTEIEEYEVVEKGKDYVTIKYKNNTEHISYPQDSGRLFNTHQEAVNYMIEQVQYEIDRCQEKLEYLEGAKREIERLSK